MTRIVGHVGREGLGDTPLRGARLSRTLKGDLASAGLHSRRGGPRARLRARRSVASTRSLPAREWTQGSAGHGGESASDGGVPGEDGAGAVDAECARRVDPQVAVTRAAARVVACTGRRDLRRWGVHGRPGWEVSTQGRGPRGMRAAPASASRPRSTSMRPSGASTLLPPRNCTSGAATTITANASGASIGGDTCGRTRPYLGTSPAAYAQSTGGPSALVIRLKGLTVTGGHVLQLTGGTEPVIFLIEGDVDRLGRHDRRQRQPGRPPGPGGTAAPAGRRRGPPRTRPARAGAGADFGTAGGYGATSSGSNGSAGGAVAANPHALAAPARESCAGGTGGGGTNNAGGAGGGAFEISAAGTISVGATGTAYLSAAGGSSPGASTSVTSNGSLSPCAGSGAPSCLVSPAAATFAHSSVVRAHGGEVRINARPLVELRCREQRLHDHRHARRRLSAPDVGGAAGAAGAPLRGDRSDVRHVRGGLRPRRHYLGRSLRTDPVGAAAAAPCR